MSGVLGRFRRFWPAARLVDDDDAAGVRVGGSGGVMVEYGFWDEEDGNNDGEDGNNDGEE